MKTASACTMISRRRGLKVILGLAAGLLLPRGNLLAWAAGLTPIIEASKQLTPRVLRPFDAETPVRAFTSFLTANDQFFVRSHFGPPSAETTGASHWQLRVGGAVDRPTVFTMKSLRQFDPVNITAVLQCSGNGRAYYRPKVPGVQWERGAVGNAQWTGVRLLDLLHAVGVRTEGRHVQFQGADRPAMVTVPPFVRSIPVEKALHPDTIVAYEMNGEPLPLLHGAPLRVITPGWMAESCIKWLTDIVVREDEATGYYMQTAYRVPARSSQNAEIMIPVEAMPVKSLIVSPESGDTVKVGSVTIQGVAWTGTSKVVSVELSMDEGKTWEPAQLLGKDQPYAWRQWQFTWSAKVPGIFPLVCRATDAQGNAQAAIRVWNPGGFLWNGWDRVTVQVNT